MNLFWIICALLLLTALVIVALPLWRQAKLVNEVKRDDSNLDIVRDQLAEMDADLNNGLLTQESYDQGKRELQARMLEEVKETEVAKTSAGSKKLIVALAILLPLFSVPLYLHLGNVDATSAQKLQMQADSSGVIRSEVGVAALETQLKNEPENPDGWYMLANSYLAMDRLMDASNAYAELIKLVPDQAQLWADYADIYGLAHGKTLQSQEVADMLAKALELNPENIKALALMASVGMERGDFLSAIQSWQKVLEVPTLTSNNANRFVENIKQARQLLSERTGGKALLEELDQRTVSSSDSEPVQPANVGVAVSGQVSLSARLTENVEPTDLVFILARAAQGPRMPLAVFRTQVQDLPLKFTLDDSMAMRPGLEISSFDEVIIVARVAKSGSPIAQSGDLEGMSMPVKPGTNGLNIVIDAVIE
jgi:cytochrome c-type biogenesis protein CcmH